MAFQFHRRWAGVLAVLAALALASCATQPGHNTGARGKSAIKRPTVDMPRPTALERYVATPDPNYRYEVVNTIPGQGYTGYICDMVSQQWRTAAEVDRPIWQHWVEIIVPDSLHYTTGMMFISGGSNDGEVPDKVDARMAQIAQMTRSVVATVYMIPNQPLVFADDGKPLKEDGLIAYTWDKYLRTGDENWPARLPMTKAVVRAMDTVQDLVARPDIPGETVDHFVVAGGSKRGWTTWTTGIVDDRVVAISPIVIDMLNMVPSFQHHYEVYGDWAEAIDDYVDRGIMDWMGTAEYESLMKIVEPYSYLDDLTMPKFIINATGDQFFLPDSSQYYWDDLKGPKYLRYVPNSGHGLDDTDAAESLLSFYASILSGAPLPQMQWSFPQEGVIQVTASPAPLAVKLWSATNPGARDFRIDVIGPVWAPQDLVAMADGSWLASVPSPVQGYTAYMVECTFAGPGDVPLKLTTPVRVLPDVTEHEYLAPQTRMSGFMTR
ncbi:MAG: PhoPQ-activated pathogenicity-related family protein [Candidatus Hydrogenedentes bacterium]|nr:PhoPQ-activated pathogenicity-related family protein [Candidatus Hydrogenedentota bacterium]